MVTAAGAWAARSRGVGVPGTLPGSPTASCPTISSIATFRKSRRPGASTRATDVPPTSRSRTEGSRPSRTAVKKWVFGVFGTPTFLRLAPVAAESGSIRTPVIHADAYGSCVRGRLRRNPRRGARADSATLGHRRRADPGVTETTLRRVRSQVAAGYRAARVTGRRSSGGDAVEALGGADALDLLSAEALLLMVQARAGAHHREEALLEARHLAHERIRVEAEAAEGRLG